MNMKSDFKYKNFTVDVVKNVWLLKNIKVVTPKIQVTKLWQQWKLLLQRWSKHIFKIQKLFYILH